MDLLVRENEFGKVAKEVLENSISKEIEFYISFLSVANFAYIMRKDNPGRLHQNIKLICSLFKVVSNKEDHLLSALNIETKDYEDAIQYETAIEAQCECILTRNEKDFKFSQIPVFYPSEFLIRLKGSAGDQSA